MVTHQLQVERRTGKVRRPETDVLPLCHATNYLQYAYSYIHICIKTTGHIVLNSKTSENEVILLSIYEFAICLLIYTQQDHFIFASFLS